MCAEPLHLQCRPPPVRSHLHLLKEADSEHCDFYKSAWYFAWLLVQRRVQCKSILLVKKVIDDDTCDLCRSGPETVNHIIFAREFWRWIGAPAASVEHLRDAPLPPTTSAAHRSCFLLLCCCQLWKHRNGVVFQSDTSFAENPPISGDVA
jgi:hypothetical protein